MAVLSFVKNNIYRLKQRYGKNIAYHIVDQHSVDTETGIKNTVLRVININKAIVLRAREYRSFVYDLAYISANKDFTTGAFFDPEDRRIIIQASDLNGHKPEIDDFIIFQNDRYDVIEKQEFENNYAYDCLCKKLRGQVVPQILTKHSGLIIEQQAAAFVVDKLTRDVSNVLNLTHNLVENT